LLLPLGAGGDEDDRQGGAQSASAPRAVEPCELLLLLLGALAQNRSCWFLKLQLGLFLKQVDAAAAAERRMNERRKVSGTFTTHQGGDDSDIKKERKKGLFQ
jgi:hypothetical protein